MFDQNLVLSILIQIEEALQKIASRAGLRFMARMKNNNAASVGYETKLCKWPTRCTAAWMPLCINA